MESKHLLLLLCLFLNRLDYSSGIKCLECVWVKGLTEPTCLSPEKNDTSLGVNCDIYEKAVSGSGTGPKTFPFCEIAWGCLDRGSERKHPALHRTCSAGPPGGDFNGSGLHCESVEPGETHDGSTINNLLVCFCNEDHCNSGHSQQILMDQDLLLVGICTGLSHRVSALLPLSLVIPLVLPPLFKFLISSLVCTSSTI